MKQRNDSIPPLIEQVITGVEHNVDGFCEGVEQKSTRMLSRGSIANPLPHASTSLIAVVVTLVRHTSSMCRVAVHEQHLQLLLSGQQQAVLGRDPHPLPVAAFG
jgi:hypothetical protein